MLPELCAGTELSPDDLPLALAGIDHTSPHQTPAGKTSTTRRVAGE